MKIAGFFCLSQFIWLIRVNPEENLHLSTSYYAMSATHNIDKLDRAILRRLQANGRETYDVIGEQVGLSPSAVLRRVKRLEDGGVIDRYVALVQPETVGLALTAYLNVRLEKYAETSKRNPMDVFRASVQTWPEVVECVALTGEMDYLMRVVVADMQHYTRFVMDTLLKHPSVQDCKTSFVMDRVKVTTAVPL
jgi:Lrp/AsnC family leucine-responsive transcriptional regulator